MTHEPSCDEFLIAATAIADGETPPLPADAVEAHLADCPSCRSEAARLAAMARLLDGCQRQTHTVDLWPEISGHVSKPPERATHPKALAAFAALAVALVGYRVLLAAVAWPAATLKLFAVALVVATFVWIKENPFAIRAEPPLGAE